MDAFVDRRLSEQEKAEVDLILVRYVCSVVIHTDNLMTHTVRAIVSSNSSWRILEDPYFMNFIRTLRPTYTPPSRYTLTTYLLPAEEARVTLLEEERLKFMKFLTMMIDGWEDHVKRSIYGSLVSEPKERPIILGLNDLTGERGTADKIVEISKESLKKKSVQPMDIIAIVTDNPTTMKAVRRKWTEKYPWVLVRISSIELYFLLTAFGQELPCFLHCINTIIGKIIAFPLVKAALSRNTKIVLSRCAIYSIYYTGYSTSYLG